MIEFSEMPKGAVSPKSSGECPKSHRVKGNQSMIYHGPDFPNYSQTIAELCFDCETNAEAAGFRRPENVDGKASDKGCISDFDAEEARLMEIAVRTANGKTASGKDLPKKSVPAYVSGEGEHTCPRSHPVKGNESSSMYHVPGGSYYKMTIPEFCFKTARDAADTGFTAPSR
jgi:hypothetical protein